MSHFTKRVSKLVIFGSLLLLFISGSCNTRQDFDSQLHSIVKPHLFSIVGWESKTIIYKLNRLIFNRQKKIDDEARVVIDYFTSAERKKDSASMAEGIIAKQIRDTLAEQGIFNPIADLDVGFPPVTFKLEQPPYVLVISPREKIESIREPTLNPNLTLEEVEDIETKVDGLDVSSLVVEIGGVGTYPSIVSNKTSLRFTIEAAVEEWLHQYLVFKPLGFLYLLDVAGISRNYEIATINETLASMLGKEIGSLVYEKYYFGYENSANQSQAPQSGFDFNQEMREIRKTVDVYLAQGEIEQAEEFMEQKRQYLASQGYYIRKLNQAYFAYYGTYADSPTSISPIGVELKKLRDKSASLKDFLNTVAAMTSRQDLDNLTK